MRYHSELSVNLSYLKYNFSQIRKLAPANKIIFMVKGDAYGHGLEKISRYAEKEIDIKEFGVASLGEAILLRDYLCESSLIYVFSDLELKKSVSIYHEKKIIPVLSSLEDIKTFIKYKQKDQTFALKFNTGMNRLGVKPSELDEAIFLLKQAKVESIFHLMTHFSHSYFKIKDGDRTHKQYNTFKQIKEKLKESFTLIGSSVSNSGAIEQSFGLDETHIRPGIMCYGPRSTNSWDGKIISSLKTKILQIEKIKKGTPIGYGGHVCHDNGFVLTIPLGYADGLLTYYSGIKINHYPKEFRIMGRVNMDLAFIFIKEDDYLEFQDIDEEFVFQFWNESQKSILEFCTQAKTIPYQVFTAITSRVPRKYYESAD